MSTQERGAVVILGIGVLFFRIGAVMAFGWGFTFFLVGMGALAVGGFGLADAWEKRSGRD